MENRHIAHLDMDAFYASVVLLRYPDLCGLPVAIGAHSIPQPIMQPNGQRLYTKLHEYSGRGVVTTSTYAARTYGILSAMGIMQAAQGYDDRPVLTAQEPKSISRETDLHVRTDRQKLSSIFTELCTRVAKN